ncbi:MAG: 3-hydroxyacyl-CoA dehydrogenase [Myxococcales bacterium]
MERITVVGAGMIGRAWSIVFARAGLPVVLHDVNPAVLAPALDLIEKSLVDLHASGLVSEPAAVIRGRVTAAASLEEALRDATYVQENALETVSAKRDVFRAMDAAARPDAILASSTSGITASSFTEDLPGRSRCLVAHPINPPSLVPLVELVPAPWTKPEVVARARALLEGVGQVPIVVARELKGFIVNRLQGALLTEAFSLVEQGYVSAEDLDKAVKDGLGLRWSFMGPFETIDLNAPGGVPDYCARYGPLYLDIARETVPRPWSDELIGKVEAERLRALPASERPARQGWRDRRLMGLVRHKRDAARENE